MTATRTLRSQKLTVNYKEGETSKGSQSISDCNPNATIDNYLAAGKAIIALSAFSDGIIKRSASYVLTEE